MSSFDQPITNIKGVGPARAKALKRLGIETVGDALRHIPRDYKDLTQLSSVSDTPHGCEAAAVAEIVGKPTTIFARKGMKLVRAQADDGQCRFACVWYNQPWVATALGSGGKWLLMGRVDARHGEKTLQSPSIEPVGSGLPAILPVYGSTLSLSQKMLRALMREILPHASEVPDPLPEAFRKRHKLIQYCEALASAHAPGSLEEAARARRRFAFEELALYLIALRLIRGERAQQVRGRAFVCPQNEIGRFIASLPYALTNAQKRALDEIAAGMRADAPMNRLVQGDVGSGKTALALGALYLAAREGRQGAFMAPTEILAQQHYETMKRALEPLGIPVGLLRRSMPAPEKRAALEAIRTGAWLAVAGTHALIEPSVKFRDLGLVVTDEQHRFGVRQRAALKAKGSEPDMLVMSATPLPRTLALILYGDLDITVLDEMPPGRTPPQTRVVQQDKREDMYRWIRAQVAGDGQAYIVCPLVEESDKTDAEAALALHEELCRGAFRGIPVALVHGRMKADEKDAAIAAFRSGEARALVSTTVVEVGVDVPAASIIAIENADRFGLAQLHQLRGRVGRAGQRSWCFLCAGEAAPEALERLKLLTKTSDGFAVAEQDLKNRGPGELLGERQSGMLDFEAMRHIGDVKLLAEVDAAVREVMEKPEFEQERMELENAANERFRKKLEHIVFN